MHIRVQEEPFESGLELQKFSSELGAAGGVVTFTGVVRNTPAGDLDRMVIEHYPGMTEKALENIAAIACERWDLTNALVIHRYGALVAGEAIMMVATSSLHRVAAFEAAEYLMDYLKSRAPFWKKEFTKDGATWVESKDHDEDALSRWS